jgi:RNA polymerase sigma-70 factor (ECF subfamily)
MQYQGAVSDLDLARRLQQGSESAWNDFYAQYSGLVRSIVLRKGWGAEHEVEDLTQSVFVALIDSIDGFQEAGSLSGFVGIIAERTCLQEYRKRTAAKRDAQTSPVDHHDQNEIGSITIGAPKEYSPENRFSRNESKMILEAALEQMEDQCKEILRLRYIDELSYNEISHILGSSENTLTVRARRCLDRLSKLYYSRVQKGI